MMNKKVIELLSKVNRKNIWDEEPIFCFTSDIDWASEAVLHQFFSTVPFEEIKLTTFVTHPSNIITLLVNDKKIERGIHPNFLAKSSHGNSFEEIIDTCIQFAPEAIGFRSHRLFDVTDITHLLASKYGYKYVSNLGSTMANYIRPILHESQLIHYPIFFEEGSHLYNQLGLSIKPFENYFKHPGIKIINFHPMNFVFNTPYLSFMRKLKDSMSREALNNIDDSIISTFKNTELGIANTINEIINFVKKNNFKILSLNEIYQTTIQ